MSIVVKTKSAEKAIASAVRRAGSKVRSKTASAVNKEITAIRKEITEDLMKKTGLKRKTINDRLSITRAKPSNLTAKLTPIYGKRIYMTDYPWKEMIARGGKQVIRLLSPIYRKNMRTGFMSKDGNRMYLKLESNDNGNKGYSVRAVKGRSIPHLFEQFKMKSKYDATIKGRVLKAIRSILK